jgi:UDP-N-acetylglucosamine 2-epimerase (non-hydrolysing)
MIKVLSIVGTRPEAIKMAPVIQALRGRPDGFVSRVCDTGQHRELLSPILDLFDIVPDHSLRVLDQAGSPTSVAAVLLARIEGVLAAERPDWVLVQGDTTSAMAAAIAAFYARARVGHVEAGLRTHDRWQPFPEEMNRRIATLVADLHFAPTELARRNLLAAGVPPDAVRVTGNPVIDAVRRIADRVEHIRPGAVPPLDPGKRLLLVTAHRRENFGERLEAICRALAEMARRYAGRIEIVYPVHLNPNVWEPVHRLLGGVAGVRLLPPLDYLSFVWVLKRAYLVLTDSGGVQEEAPSLGKPVLVLRQSTERPEGVRAGAAKLVGPAFEHIVGETSRLLDDSAEYARMAHVVNPYGDGHAAMRIVQSLVSLDNSAGGTVI